MVYRSQNGDVSLSMYKDDNESTGKPLVLSLNFNKSIKLVGEAQQLK